MSVPVDANAAQRVSRPSSRSTPSTLSSSGIAKPRSAGAVCIADSTGANQNGTRELLAAPSATSRMSASPNPARYFTKDSAIHSTPAAARVMVVEDAPAVRAAVTAYLQSLGLHVDEHGNGVSASRALAEQPPDVLVVDRMLPGLSGDELSREAREVGSIPILMLTALAEVEDRIEGLEIGADDYLAKPFSLRELALRVQALLRRSRAALTAVDTLTAGRFTCDAAHRRAWVDGEEVLLKGREYELLHYLLRHPGETIARDRLLQEIWGWRFGDASTVTVQVRRLRENIEPDLTEPRYLRTVWGVGYCFTPNGGRA